MHVCCWWCWGCDRVQGCLLRAGQPLSAGGKRCYEDEKYFRKILSCCEPPASRGVIWDLRSQADAKVGCCCRSWSFSFLLRSLTSSDLISWVFLCP